MTSPTGQKWTFGYDADGNQISMVDANGNSTPAAGDGTTTRACDAAGRLTSIAYSDSTPGASFTYDAVGNTTQMTDGGGAQTVHLRRRESPHGRYPRNRHVLLCVRPRRKSHVPNVPRRR